MFEVFDMHNNLIVIVMDWGNSTKSWLFTTEEIKMFMNIYT